MARVCVCVSRDSQEIALIFPHQLFVDHPGVEKDRPVWMIEDPLFFGDARHPADFHVQKLALHRASMTAWAEAREKQGHDIHWLRHHPGLASDRLFEKLPGIARRVHLCAVDDYLLDRRLRRWADRQAVDLVWHDSPLFLTPDDWADSFFNRKPKAIMADFYREQRRRLGLLVEEDGSPVGGKWSFDAENRKRLPEGHEPPGFPAPSRHRHLGPALESARSDFPDAPGRAEGFIWPVDRRAALRWLDTFLEKRLDLFGDYEDAIHSEHRLIYHAAITPALNIGLVTPADIIERTTAAAADRDIPLNALEGFLRQVTGWREFMRLMYHRHGSTMRTRNFWEFDRPMPRAFYTGDTGIAPVDRVIRGVLASGWCHHIERLMVLGSFMLLCRIRPDDVYRWFMELFVDAYDWVMVPNVYGMSQFADGGLFTTKPYICGSNYIAKMSDWKKTKDWAPVWDGLYWTFVADHRDVFAANPRMGMMARLVDRMGEEKLRDHRKAAEKFLDKLD